MYYIPTIYININKAHMSPMRHVGVRVGPRGSATGPHCHVASTRVPREINPPFIIYLFIILNDFKSKINS